jgi:hypothetical protein
LLLIDVLFDVRAERGGASLLKDVVKFDYAKICDAGCGVKENSQNVFFGIVFY